MRRVSRIYLAAGVVLTGVYFAFPAGGTAQTVIYTALGTGASLALLSTRSPAWMLLGAGNACFTVGDVLSVYHPTHLMDGFYLAGYPLLVAGLLTLMLLAAERRRFAALADAGIVLFAFAIFQWLFVLSSTVGSGFVAAAYPVADIVLLGGFAGFFVSPAWRCPSFGYLVGAVSLLLLGDEIVLRIAYSAGAWVDATWMLAYILWGTAALDPSRAALAQARRRPGSVSPTAASASWPPRC